jgi:5-formyltetrahydrofolate cyclo-ligase
LSPDPPDPRAAKRALRRDAVAAILALDPEERRRQESALMALVPALPGFPGAGTVLLYARAFPEEIDTAPLLRAALEAGRRLVLPRVDRAARALRLHVVEDPGRDLRPGTLGIPEPDPGCPAADPRAIDWALVPGLLFDRRGYRLGRGAGHYDRLLPTLRPDATRWAIALDPQLVGALPVEPHDQPLDGVAGPSGAWAVGRGG